MEFEHAEPGRDALPRTAPSEAKQPRSARVLALQRAAGNRATRRVLARNGPLLLTDRPWREIEAEREEAERRRRAGETPGTELSGLQLPIVIHLPKEEPPLLLTDRPWSEIERLRANRQTDLGQYRDEPEGGGLDDEALAGARQLEEMPAYATAQGEARAIWDQYMATYKKLDAQIKKLPELQQLHLRAMRAAGAVAADPDLASQTALATAAEAALSWIADYRQQRAQEARAAPKTEKGAVGRWKAKVKAVQDLANALQDSLGKGNPRKKDVTTAILALNALETKTTGGYSRNDEDRLAQLDAEIHTLAQGVKIKDQGAAKALARDLDDDGRLGNEPTLSYRGDTYYLMPGWLHPPTYGRIDPALGLLAEQQRAYQHALQIGRIPANEQGASGVKEKPLHFEIKLIARTAKRLMGDSDLRLKNEHDPLVQRLSNGRTIRYITFDRRHNAH